MVASTGHLAAVKAMKSIAGFGAAVAVVVAVVVVVVDDTAVVVT